MCGNLAYHIHSKSRAKFSELSKDGQRDVRRYIATPCARGACEASEVSVKAVIPFGVRVWRGRVPPVIARRKRIALFVIDIFVNKYLPASPRASLVGGPRPGHTPFAATRGACSSRPVPGHAARALAQWAGGAGSVARHAPCRGAVIVVGACKASQAPAQRARDISLATHGLGANERTAAVAYGAPRQHGHISHVAQHSGPRAGGGDGGGGGGQAKVASQRPHAAAARTRHHWSGSHGPGALAQPAVGQKPWTGDGAGTQRAAAAESAASRTQLAARRRLMARRRNNQSESAKHSRTNSKSTPAIWP